MRAHRDSLINLGANRGVNAQRIAELNAQLSIMDGYARNLANGVVPTQAMTQAFEVARDSAGDMLA